MMNRSTTRFGAVVALLQLLFLTVGQANDFETHYQTLLGNLAGSTLEDIYDGMDVHDLETNAESFDETCLTETDLETEYTIVDPNSVTAAELINICPALLYRALTAHDCGHDDHDDEHETTGYGYSWGLLAIFLISLSPIFGIPLIRYQKDRSLWFLLLIQFLIALGVSAMACDSLMHLWPEAVGLHAHDHGEHEEHSDHGEEEEEDRTYLWRTVGMVITLYLFFVFETTLHLFLKTKRDADGPQHEVPLSNERIGEKGGVENAEGTNTGSQDQLFSKTWFGIPEDKLVTTLVLSVSDCFCNFTDGLAIGVAFQQSSSSGVSTAIAVWCHEFPQEIGSFAILIDFGVQLIPALVLNVLSAVCAFIGLFMGAALSEHEEWGQWATAFAAGAFLYIALIDMLPQMMAVKTDRPWLVYFVQNMGLIIGFVIMLLIALYEEDIEV